MSLTLLKKKKNHSHRLLFSPEADCPLLREKRKSSLQVLRLSLGKTLIPSVIRALS